MNMNKKVNWVIDKYLFDEYEDNLKDVIINSGNNVFLYDDVKDDTFKVFLNKKFINNDIVVFHGSLQHGQQISHLPMYPGVLLTLDNYECYKYYGYFGDYLLNSKYMMFGLNDILRNKERIFETLKTEKLFIRPSNGFKSFAGQLLPKEGFDFELNVLMQSYGGLDTNTIVILAETQDIEEEYRFIVVDGEVVSGSLYLDKNNRDDFQPYYDRICDDEKAIEFANKMSKLYQPDKAYTIDVCRLGNGEYKMIEINSFFCASMYGNDYKKVVETVNKLAINEYNELFTL